VIFAAVVGVILSLSLTPEQTASWGWRVPFLVGSLIVPFLFWIRRGLHETDSFRSRTAERRPGLREVYRTLLRSWPVVLNAVLLVTLTSVMFYLITTYTPTFGEQELGLTYLDSFIVTVCVGVSNLIWIPVVGALSDRFGRVPLLAGAAGLTAVTAYPVMTWLTTAPSFTRLLLVLLWLSLLYGGYQGAMVVTLTEIMPATVRATGFALAYSLAQAIFGGFTPAIATGLIHLTGGQKAMPGAWLAFAALISLLGIVLVRRAGTGFPEKAPGVHADPEVTHGAASSGHVQG
jgi:MFS family permease